MPIKLNENSVEKIPHSCLVRLQATYDSLKSAEKKAADLLLEHPDFFAGASIVEAAREAGCSEATLVRLARRLGYGGYPELKAHLIEGKKGSPMLYSDITDEDDYNTILIKVFQASIQALKDTMNLLDREEYKRAVDCLCHAGKIVILGVGDAAAVARSGYQKFIRAGLNVQMSADLDQQLITVSHLSKEDVVIAVSHSGRTKSLLDVVKQAKATGATVIAITNYPVSPLTKNSDIVLLTAAFAQHMIGEIMSKRITELCLLESLFINTLKCRPDLVQNIEKSNLALEVNKLKG
ncbi:MAG: MurR/RpiR family transcriptional regulator [Bacillota bacterium]